MLFIYEHIVASSFKNEHEIYDFLLKSYITVLDIRVSEYERESLYVIYSLLNKLDF